MGKAAGEAAGEAAGSKETGLSANAIRKVRPP